jgi:hypothetical protein
MTCVRDRFTGWNAIVSTLPGKFDGQNLVTSMRDFCTTCNIPEHVTTDGGPRSKDHIPCLPYKYAANAYWCVSQELKERIMAKSREVEGEKLARKSLHIGTTVNIQNQSGR